jgi:hypothetical protein
MPFAAFANTQAPLGWSQLAALQGSLEVQLLGLPPVQAPAWQVSV